MKHNKDFESDSPIVTVLASAAPARTRANYGSRLKSLLCGIGTNLLAHIQSPRSSDRFLYTAYGNFAAIKIYEDFGFQITEVADYKIQGEIIQIVKMQQIGS
jgi:hypothetical protein